MLPENKKVGAIGSLPFPRPGDEVVISGIAGRFPESDNLTDLKENLFNKRDLITDDTRRWKSDHQDIPQPSGKLNNINKFDSQFFEVNFEDAQTMDPIGRMLLEHAYEAIVDAGFNPRQLRGTKTGVFIGNSFSDSDLELIYEKNQVGGSGVLGCSRSILANRISYWLGTTGPSYNVDTACSSSMYAMDHAYRAIASGECDAALVGSSQLCLNPLLTMQFGMLGLLSPDGRSKSFDADGNGCVRSEAVCVIYLQKAKNARRIYANVVYTRTNCDGFKEQGITFPSSPMQTALLRQFYEDCGVPPTSLAYVEAHGTGTTVGDPVELVSLDKVFCPGRSTPLKIGSVKSNLGHTEAASGICSIAKVIIAMETGYIPPNIHYNRPRGDMTALVEGRMEVVTEMTPWDGGYIGVNSFGFGGANAHVLLKSNPKEKIDGGAPKDNLPRLVVVSGRTRKAVETLLNDLESRPVDVEFISLFHNIHSEEIPGHWYRGYTILPPQNSQNPPVRNVQYYRSTEQPIWFVFSGMGTSLTSMGKALLKLPIFVNAVQKCDAVLRPHGINIVDILTTESSKMLENISNSFVGIAVAQIGLVDVLASLGIVPDKIIGHSMGELGCAYADGCLTAEQVVLSAYYQGLNLIETRALTEVGTDNGSGTSMISSSSLDTREELVTRLQDNRVCDRGESCTRNANVDQHISTIGQKVLAHLQTIIPDPKPRSRKWLNASVLCGESKMSSKISFSPHSHANTLPTTRPVPFEEILRIVPKSAIAIEITPHGLLQTILCSSVSGKVDSIASDNHKNKDPMLLLLQGIGEMYGVGLLPQLTNLYPDIQYPVSRGTPMISPLIRWNHSKDWFVQKYTAQRKIETGHRVVEIAIADEMYEWMAGHVIDGRNLVPASGYLVMVWETVAMMKGELYEDVSVVFEHVKFHRATNIPRQRSIQLNIMIQKGSGRFEVSESNTTVATGFIRTVPNSTQGYGTVDMQTNNNEPLELTDEDIYKELRLRGYRYAGLFRGLKGASLNGTEGLITWNDNWMTFVDNMLQIGILRFDTRSLLVPMAIQMLKIDPERHRTQLRTMPDHKKEFTVKVHKDVSIIIAGGVELRGFRTSNITRKIVTGDPVLEEFKFIAHRDHNEMELKAVTCLATHIALENEPHIKIKTIEIIGEADDESPRILLSPFINEILENLPLVEPNVNIIAPHAKLHAETLPTTIRISPINELSVENDASLVIGLGLLTSKDTEQLRKHIRALKDSGFLLAREPLNTDINILVSARIEKLDVILEKRTDRELVYLLRKRPKMAKVSTVIHINNHGFTWLPQLQAALKMDIEKEYGGRNRILVVSEGNFESGLMGLINCLRKEPGGQYIQGLLIQDLQAPKFSLEDPFYSKQLDLGLALNVLRPNKVWGTYRFMAMKPLPLRPVHHVQIAQHAYGDLHSLKWVEGRILPGCRHKNVMEVHYASLNFRDIMISTAKLAAEEPTKSRMVKEHVIGFEFSGRDVNGQAVMGLIGCGGFSNLCVPDTQLLWPVPSDWTLEDAATVPAVYVTAYHALLMKGRIKKGDRILIHAGSGGVGQAAITLALHKGCEVFTTVGTSQKRKFIRNKFPQISADHIGNSRDTSFEQMIFRGTHGRGVDIVLNSLAGDKFQASVRCLAKGGQFLEIGKFELAKNSSIGMEVFSRGASFHGVYVDSLFDDITERKTKLVAMLTEGIKSGVVKPLVRTVFPMAETEAAFRYLAEGKHIGKVILKIREENAVGDFSLPRGIPRHYCSEDGSNLILGGLGGFGLELADWLALRGAKKLVLTSRKGITSGYQRLRINIWESYGVKVIIIVGKDASTREGCGEILREAETLGPVEAIFHLAVILKDALFENQTIESFEESFRVKAWTTEQLDKLSRTMCPRLKQFVVFSSVSCGRGNAGQTNYGMSNSVMERICEARAAENLPGLAVQWGAIGDIGLVAEMQEDDTEVAIGGTLPQRISSCLQELDGFLQQNSPVVSSVVVAKKKAGEHHTATILDTVITIMGIKSLKTVSLHLPLVDLGMDSMMAFEIQQTVEREFGVSLTAEDIRTLNFIQLEDISSNQAGDNKSRKQVKGNSREVF